MSAGDSLGMARARQHMECWRREHGGPGVRIPEELWDEAVGVARGEGLSKTARALRLDQHRLKARAMHVQEVDGTSDRVEATEPTFVEVGIGPLGGSRTVVDFAGRDGDRMRIEVTGPVAVDVVGLSRAFWSRQA